MKTTKVFGILLVSLAFSACELNQSVHKDLITGAYSKGDGIVCLDVTTTINNKIENRNSFIYGEKVNFTFEGIHGLTKENEKVYPELSMCIIQNEKDTVLYNPHLLGDLKDGTDLSPLKLQANFISALSFENDEKYKVYVTISDEKGDGRFTYELPFSVEENKVLQINSSDFTYSGVFLWDETEQLAVVDEVVSAGNTLFVIFEGVDGLEIVDGKVYPSLSFDITDSKGNQIMSNSNVLSEYESSGFEYSTFKNGQPIIGIVLSPEQINNPYKLKGALTDLKSDKRIDIEGILEIK